jgi:hypothetical protein
MLILNAESLSKSALALASTVQAYIETHRASLAAAAGQVTGQVPVAAATVAPAAAPATPTLRVHAGGSAKLKPGTKVLTPDNVLRIVRRKSREGDGYYCLLPNETGQGTRFDTKDLRIVQDNAPATPAPVQAAPVSNSPVIATQETAKPDPTASAAASPTPAVANTQVSTSSDPTPAPAAPTPVQTQAPSQVTAPVAYPAIQRVLDLLPDEWKEDPVPTPEPVSATVPTQSQVAQPAVSVTSPSTATAAASKSTSSDIPPEHANALANKNARKVLQGLKRLGTAPDHKAIAGETGIKGVQVIEILRSLMPLDPPVISFAENMTNYTLTKFGMSLLGDPNDSAKAEAKVEAAAIATEAPYGLDAGHTEDSWK